jgi:hypothetical protein
LSKAALVTFSALLPCEGYHLSRNGFVRNVKVNLRRATQRSQKKRIDLIGLKTALSFDEGCEEPPCVVTIAYEIK